MSQSTIVHDASRERLRRLFKVPILTKVHAPDTWIPGRTSNSWTRIDPCPGHLVPPPTKLPTTEALFARVVKGRLARGALLDLPEFYLMISILPRNRIIPPHPGFRSALCEDYAHPMLTFTDGSLGKWDYTQFPQLWVSGRPWWAFISLPLLPTHPDIPLEQWNSTYFFFFPPNSTYPFKDGRWLYDRLSGLLARRTEAEAEFLAGASSAPDVLLTMQNQFASTLPYFDPLEMEECRRWKEFREGRDAVSRILRYVRELRGMTRWIREVTRQKETPNVAYHTRSDLMGVWTGTISHSHEWEMLRLAGVPLYSLFKLGPSHRLAAQWQNGWLDNDERYRQDPVGALVDRNNSSLERFFSSPLPPPEQHPTPKITPLPAEWADLTTVCPPEGRTAVPQSTATCHPFTTYIFEDRSVDRFWPPGDVWYIGHKNVHDAARRIRNLMISPPMYPPGSEPRLEDQNLVHPILAVLPKWRDKGKIMIFTEENEADCFWPVQLTQSACRKRKDWRDNYKFNFTFDNGHVMVYSNFPWPDTNELSDDESMDAHVQYILPKWRYFPSEPSDNALYKQTPALGAAPPAVIRAAQLQPGTSSGSRLGPSSFTRQRPFTAGYPAEPGSSGDVGPSPHSRLKSRANPVVDPYALLEDDSDEIPRRAMIRTSRSAAARSPTPPTPPRSPTPLTDQLRTYFYHKVLEIIESPVLEHSPADAEGDVKMSDDDDEPEQAAAKKYVALLEKAVFNRYADSGKKGMRFAGPKYKARCITLSDDLKNSDHTSLRTGIAAGSIIAADLAEMPSEVLAKELAKHKKENTVQRQYDSSLNDSNETRPWDSIPSLGSSSSIPTASRDQWSARRSEAPYSSRYESQEARELTQFRSGSRGPQQDRSGRSVSGSRGPRRDRSERSRSPKRHVPGAPDDEHRRERSPQQLAAPVSSPQGSSLAHAPVAPVEEVLQPRVTQDSIAEPEKSATRVSASATPQRPSPTTQLQEPIEPAITDAALFGNDTSIDIAAEAQLLEELVDARLWSAAYYACRLFSPLAPRAPVPKQAICSSFHGGTFCYAVRVSNIAPPLTVSALHQISQINDWGDIVAVSLREEPDTTISADVGFRYVEDALMMWGQAGTKHEGRFWAFEGITGVFGSTHFMQASPTPRPPKERIGRVQLCIKLEEQLPIHVRDSTHLITLKQLETELVARNVGGVSDMGSDGDQTFQHRLRQAGLAGNTIWPTVDSGDATQGAIVIWVPLRPDATWKPIEVPTLLDFYEGPPPFPEPTPSSSSANPPEPSPRRFGKKKHQSVPQRPKETDATGQGSGSMNARERDLCLRAINRRSKAKFDAWHSQRVPLPPIPLTDVIEPSEKPSIRLRQALDLNARGINASIPIAKPSGFGFVHCFFRLWDWYEDCLACINGARERLDSNGYLEPPLHTAGTVDPEEKALILNVTYDSLSDMEAAFSISTRMLEVYGAEYADIEANLKKRRADAPVPISTQTDDYMFE